MSTNFKKSLLTTSVFVSVAAIASPAFAQDATAESEDTAIVVTGTLIRNPNLEQSSPVAVIGQDEIQLRQSNNAEELIRDIPGATPNLGSNVNNGTVGSSRVDLRGLGANRNIVLIDAQRLVPSDFSGIVDLNNVPVALIERVDVLTGGASTTYGADAVSGVVNFITRRDFAGMDLTASEQITQEGDGNVFRVDLVVGANFDDGRGNAVLAVGYQEADPIYFGDRPYGTHTVSSANGVAAGDSFTSVPTAFSFPTGDFQINTTGTALVDFYNAFNFNPFNIYVTPFERFNIFAKANYEISDTVEVYTRGMFSKNTVSSIIAASGIFGTPGLTVPGQNPYLPAGIRDQLCTLNGIALGPTCDTNPAIPLGSVYRRSVELGPRVSEYVTQFFDYTAGVRVNLLESLQLDVYGSYGESENEETRSGYVANSRVQQALNATDTTSCFNTDNACVPLNLFGIQGSITPEMGAFVGGITSSVTNRATLAQVHGVLSGDVGFTAPWAEEPVAFAVGGEYREYGAQRRPDNLASVPGELGGAGGAVLPLDGGFNVYEAFGELIAPLVADRPFFEELTLEAGVRYSKYKVDAAGTPKFDATTYKFGATWAPISDIKFRGNYQRAVRAPNIGELFAPVVTGLTNLLFDPCAGSSVAVINGGANPNFNPGLVAGQNLRAICLAQGAPTAAIDALTTNPDTGVQTAIGIQNPSAGQANSTGGGNPNIRPEKATTYSLGIILQPQDFIRGLTVTLDYYNIEVENAITTATPDDVIGACFDNITAASAADPACTGIRRSTTNGRLSGTSTAANPLPGLPTPLTNNGTIKTDGIDLTVSYRTSGLGFADLALSFNGNYTFSSEFQASPTSDPRECTGYYSTNCGISNGLTVGSLTPEFQWNQRTTLSFESVDVSLLWRHIDSLRYEPGLQPLFAGTITGAGPLVGKEVDFNKIKAFDYFDLTTRFDVTENFEFIFSVQNLFDKSPPLVGSSAGSTTYNGGNTYPSTYDTIGRRFAASARLKF